MTRSICFKCAADKTNPLAVCPSCGGVPENTSAWALSLVLSEHLSNGAQLTEFAAAIRSGNHLRLPIRPGQFERARAALHDPQFQALLRGATGTAAPPPATRPAAANAGTAPGPSLTLRLSPFVLLGVTNRDNRTTITDRAEHRSLELDPDACQRARGELTNPRQRLSAEMAWLPGLSPGRAERLLNRVAGDSRVVRGEAGLPRLAHCNLMAAAFEAVPAEHPPYDLADFILEFARLVSALDATEIVREINEDRAVSGFPQLKAADQVADELSERQRYFRSVIQDALDRQPSAALLKTVTLAVTRATRDGAQPAPELIDELVDAYTLETRGVLEREGENARTLIDRIRAQASAGEAAVIPLIEALARVVRNWDSVAQPIQLSAKARGIDHQESLSLAHLIRGLAVELFNDHDMLKPAQHLTALLQDSFAELPAICERLAEDRDTLAGIDAARARDAQQAQARDAEWARTVTFSAEVGMLTKERLAIAPSGITWRGRQVPLAAVTAVRWGAVSHSVNGIPTGTDYTIAFATANGATAIELRNEATYTGFIDTLWRAVCVRLMIHMIEALAAGEGLTCGDLLVEDTGVTLTRHKLLGRNERLRVPWRETQLRSANGELVIRAKYKQDVYGSASFMDDWNTHLIHHIVRSAQEQRLTRLSTAFKK